MNASPIALLAGGPGMAVTLDKVAAELAQAGAAVARCESAADYLSDPLQAAQVGVLVTAGPVTPDMLRGASDLRAVISPLIGIDTIDEAGIAAMGIIVANGQSEENAGSVAEATMLLILASLYDLNGSQAVLGQGVPRASPVKARMLKGKTVGVIGYGNSAKGVLQRLEGWGVERLLHTRTPPDPAPPGVTVTGLDDLLQASDVVVVLTSLNPSTVNLIDARRLALLKPDAVLVNVARGGIVDEAALSTLMAERPDMRVALDVFAVEPPPADHPLLGRPNIITTPHMIAHTRESTTALPRLAAAQALAALRGEPPAHTRDRSILPAWLARWAPEGSR